MEQVPVENCTGCTACQFCCPQTAIQMEEDCEGFLYPRVDLEKCNKCGLCRKICPAENKRSDLPQTPLIVYAGWTKDQTLLRESTSGGIFSELARPVLQDGGVVFGAAYDERMVVRHKAVETWEDLKYLRGSKYVQSNMGKAYQQAQEYLKAGRRVLFSGTPCQVAGLYAVIGRRPENLLTCDLVCHGVPSPKVFKTATTALEKQFNAKIMDYRFREKSFGWLHPTVQVSMKNGKCFKENPRDNFFLNGFYSNLFLRPSCYNCPMKPLVSEGDITLGDFWEIPKTDPVLFNPDGTSLLLIHTKKGRAAIKQADGKLHFREYPYDRITNINLKLSATLSAQREGFFAEFDRLTYSELSAKYMKTRSPLVRKLIFLYRLMRWGTEKIKRGAIRRAD